jgi:putative membrane protein
MWQKVSVFPSFITVSVALPLLAVAQATNPVAPQSPQWPHSHGPGYMWGDHPGWHFWWMPLMMLTFVVIILVAMRFFGFGRRWPMMHGASRDPSSSAIEILNERFAKGEIDENEYEEKKAKILST